VARKTKIKQEITKKNLRRERIPTPLATHEVIGRVIDTRERGGDLGDSNERA
jgi:hypothetical protein